MAKHPRIFILALLWLPAAALRSFARMRHHRLRKTANDSCVPGSPGSPRRSVSDAEAGPEETLWSSMDCRAFAPAARRAAVRFATLAVLAVFGLHSVPLHAESARSMFKRGQAAEAREDFDTAFVEHQKAAAKAPKDLEFRTALIRVRVSASGLHMTKGRKLLQGGDQPGALAEFLHAAEIDPGNEAAQQEIARVRAQQGQASPQTETSLPQ